MRLLPVFAALFLILDSVLAINTCPNACTDSGSTKCKSLGCAYCGKSCDRRLLEELEAAAGDGDGTHRNNNRNRELQLLGKASPCVPLADKLTIEAAMNIDVSKYCDGAPGCSIIVRAEPIVL
jgi:hypothetical protein